MHPYATDSSERRNVPILIAVTAIVSAFILAKIVTSLGLQDRLWWVDLPAVSGFYGIYWKLFDKYMWRCPFVTAIGLVRVPDFSGEWVGEGESSHLESGQRKKYDFKCRIRQQWTRFCVWGETEGSRSESLIGAIMVDDGEYPTISYEYRNQPKADAAATMHPHLGMVRLERVNPDELRGEYYTGRDRQNYGSLHLHKRRLD